MSDLRLVPVTRAQAHAFIRRVHRHHAPPLGEIYRIGLASGTVPVGVATVGRPIARAFDNGLTVEVTRVATDGSFNACSMLYGACWRVARGLGYTSAITYTQEDESGASLRASSWIPEAELEPRGDWNTPSRPRYNTTGGIGRIRWRAGAPVAHPETLPSVEWPDTIEPVPSLFDFL